MYVAALERNFFQNHRGIRRVQNEEPGGEVRLVLGMSHFTQK